MRLPPKRIILCKCCHHVLRTPEDGIVVYDEQMREFGVYHRYGCAPKPARNVYRFELGDMYRDCDYFRSLFNCEIMNGHLEQTEVAYLLLLVYQNYDAGEYFDFGEREYRDFYRMNASH